MFAISTHLRRFVASTRVIAAAALLSSAAVLGGCRNDAQTGALAGGLLGAGAGAIIGHQSGEALAGAGIGAAVGGVGGYIIGNESDKDRYARYHYYDDRGHYRGGYYERDYCDDDYRPRPRRHPRYDY
jgi:hypothetical protein